MPDAISLQVANAVVAELSSATFSAAITPAVRLVPYNEMDDFDDVRVTVAPQILQEQAASRSDTMQTLLITIGIEKKVGVPDPTTADADAMATVNVAEEIARFIRHRKLSNYQKAKYIRHTIDPLLDPDSLASHGIAQSIIQISYLVSV